MALFSQQSAHQQPNDQFSYQKVPPTLFDLPYQRNGKINRILVTGCNGQLGNGLIDFLNLKYGAVNILGTDLKKPAHKKYENFEELNVLDRDRLKKLIEEFKPDLVMNLAAILSASGEKNPALCYDINLPGFKNVLDLCAENKIMMFSPSTIAAYGPSTPKLGTPNETIMRPTTMYGVTKVANELLGTYYKQKFGLDFRSLRYPQVVSCDKPGGGSGDYAVEIFIEALKQKKYQCYLHEQTRMPMIYVDDLIYGTMKYLETDINKLSTTTYNIQSCSFTCKQLAGYIKTHVPELEVTYKPDFRQQIVNSWPEDLDDSLAKNDWGWQPYYGISQLTDKMVILVKEKFL